MKFSMIPFIFIFQIVFLSLAVRTTLLAKNISNIQAKSLFVIIALLVIWGPISTYFALNGVYKLPFVMNNLPSFWYSMVPILLLMGPWLFSSRFKTSINKIIESVGIHKVVFFEGIRILAIGGIIKGMRGEFSAEFAFFIGIPDFIFGALSLLAGYLLYKKSLPLKWVLFLNIFGFIIIIPFALVVINLGIPGPWHIIHSTPDTVSMLEYPMAVASTVVVPIFVVINVFIINYVLSLKAIRPT